MEPDARAVTVEVFAGGERLARRTITARRCRWALPVAAVRFRLPAGDLGDCAGSAGPGWTVHVRSDTHLPRGPRSDERLLGVSVIAALAGPRRHQLLQLVHQPLAAAASDLTFLRSYDRVAANSAFTARWVRRLWAVDASLLHPPISRQAAGRKGPVILHVGRFFPPHAGHSKRQAELVEAFRQLTGRGLADGWELHLVGGCDDDGRAYLDAVRAAIDGLAVDVHANAARGELQELFGRASIYWHATGLGDDPDAHPERMEHFGISTVEAMSAGAVPVCIGVAGQLEVFDDGVEGFHFSTVDQLVERTAELIADPALRTRMGAAAQRRAARYDERAFAERLQALVAEITAIGG
jgi:glycosyltransferase involved in cell wall biosynthesis